MADYKRHRNTIIIEDVNIWAGPWRNFSGEAGTYNAEGARNFWIEVPEDLAEEMEKDHWNVKHRPDKQDPDIMHHIIKINVNYRSDNPPEIYILNKKRKRKTLMPESLVHKIDKYYILYADISFNSYRREWGDGRITTTGWLQELTIEVEENYLQEKYADYDEVSSDSLVEDEDVPF